MEPRIDPVKFPLVAAKGEPELAVAVQRMRGAADRLEAVRVDLRRDHDQIHQLVVRAKELPDPPRGHQEERLHQAWTDDYTDWELRRRALAKRMRALARDPALQGEPGAEDTAGFLAALAEEYLESDLKKKRQSGNGSAKGLEEPSVTDADAEKDFTTVLEKLKRFGEGLRGYADGLARGEETALAQLEEAMASRANGT